MEFTPEHLTAIKSRKDAIRIANQNNISIAKTLSKLKYEAELRKLQSELVTLQQWIAKTKRRVVVIFEGRDASGKGGAIKRFKEHLNPRSSRVVALTNPLQLSKDSGILDAISKCYPIQAKLFFLTEAGIIALWLNPSWSFALKISMINS